MGEGSILVHLHGLDRELVKMDTKISKYYPMLFLTHSPKEGIIKIVAQNQEMMEMNMKISKYYPTPTLTLDLQKGIIKIRTQNQDIFRR